jgi:SHS2 domain-containing protein
VRYEAIEHTADAGIVAHGASLAKLFENAAYGTFDLMFDLSSLEPDAEIQLVIPTEDHPADLMYRWLVELLYRFEVDEKVWCKFVVTMDDQGLSARVGGANSGGVELRGTPIKAVTLHELSIVEHARDWTATVLFDV